MKFRPIKKKSLLVESIHPLNSWAEASPVSVDGSLLCLLLLLQQRGWIGGFWFACYWVCCYVCCCFCCCVCRCFASAAGAEDSALYVDGSAVLSGAVYAAVYAALAETDVLLCLLFWVLRWLFIQLGHSYLLHLGLQLSLLL
jgi:hypothetical protein